MKILVTGASGYIGNRLAHQLAKEQHEVVALIRTPAAKAHLTHPNIQTCLGDICEPASVISAMKGCRQVYHVAGYVRLFAPDPAIFYKVNLDGTRIILDAALHENVDKLVYTSSTAVLGPSLSQPTIESDPRSVAFNNDYDLSKYLAEEEVHKYIGFGLNAVIVNPSRVYGPGLTSPSNAIGGMLQKALHGKLLLLPRKPDAIGNYAYIEDVVSGHINAMYLGKCGERYILGGENKSIKEVIDTITRIIGPFPILSIPLPAMKIILQGLAAYKKITGQSVSYGSSGIDRYTRNMAFDCSKAKHEILYKITPFTIGIEHTINQIKTELPWQTKFSPL